jgi:hypothetical protein
VHDSSTLTLGLDATTTHRNTPLFTLMLSNEEHGQFVLSSFQFIPKDGIQIGKAVWEELQKIRIRDELFKKLKVRTFEKFIF